MNVIAKAMVCAGMAVTGSVFAETYSFQGTEWDNEMAEAREFPLEPGTVYAVTCRMRHMTERNVRGSLLLSVGDYGMGWTPLGNNHAQIDFAAAFLTAADMKGGAKTLAALRKSLEKAGLVVDYVECVDAETLEPRKTPKKGCCILVAAFCGKTRLIDNRVL